MCSQAGYGVEGFFFLCIIPDISDKLKNNNNIRPSPSHLLSGGGLSVFTTVCISACYIFSFHINFFPEICIFKFLSIYFVVVELLSCIQLFCDPVDCSPPDASVHGISQARILEWVAHFRLQGIFLTQGSNPCLLRWQVDFLPLSHQGSLIINLCLCWVFFFFFKLYIIALVLPNIKMNPPQVYMCSPS